MINKTFASMGLPITEAEYRAIPAISYSKIASFIKDGPKALIAAPITDNKYLQEGSLLDTMLTEPENLNIKFLIKDLDNITDYIKSTVERLFAKYPAKNSLKDISSTDILKVLNEVNFYTAWKDITRINKIIDDGSSYFKLLKESLGKTIMSTETYEKVQMAVQVLNTHPSLSKYIVANPFNDKIEIASQTKFSIDLNGYKVKCMFDRVYIDHENKTILPIDFKKSSYEEETFETTFIMWKYYIQALLYKRILQKVITLDDYFKDFEILPFSFIVINLNTLNPIMWVVRDEKAICEQLYKAKLLHSPSFDSLYVTMNDIQWHLDTNIFNCSRETYTKQSIRDIKLDNIQHGK